MLEPTRSARYYWWLPLLRGLLALGYGILALAFPGATAGELMAFVATYVVAESVMAILSAVRLRPHFMHWWLLLVPALLGGVYTALVLLGPSLSLVRLVSIASLWWLLSSVAQFLVARGQVVIAGSAGWSIVEGILSIALAITVLGWPLTVANLVMVFAWLGVFLGLGRVVVAFEVRSVVEAQNRRTPQPS